MRVVQLAFPVAILCLVATSCQRVDQSHLASFEPTATKPTVTPIMLNTLVIHPTATANVDISLATQDGLGMVFNTLSEKFASLYMPGYEADLSQSPDLGVYLYGPAGESLLDASVTPLTSYQMVGESLRLIRENPSEGIKTVETWTAFERHIELEATISNAGDKPESRAIEACVQLPLDLVGKQWHHHLDQSETIERRSEPYQTLLTRLVDIGSFGDGSYHLKSDLDFNLHGLNVVGDNTFGLALAIDPKKPAAYSVRYDPTHKSYDACFHLGIYEGHIQNNDRVTFNLVFFFPDEPEWGFRSALQKYISIFPESFAGHLAPQTRMTIEGYGHKIHPNPEQFHIGASWSGFRAENVQNGMYNLAYIWPSGFWDSGMRLIPIEAPYGSKPTGEEKLETHIAVCLQIYRDFDEGQNPFLQTCGEYFDSCNQTHPTGQIYGPIYDSSTDQFHALQAFQVKVSNAPKHLFGQFRHDPISNSLLQNASGGHAGAMSYASAMYAVSWEPDYVRCLFNGINPDPGLEVIPSNQPSPGPAPEQTRTFGHLNLEIIKRAHGLYGNAYRHEHPTEGLRVYNGAAVDTVGASLRPDFNPAMLRVASLPLGYDRASGQVVALEHLGYYALIRAVRASLPDDAALVINGRPISGITGPGVDFFMAEMGVKHISGERVSELYDMDTQAKTRRIDRIRMTAYQRPITFWAAFDRADTQQELLEQMRQLLPLYTSKGIYINPQKYGRETEYFWYAELSSVVIEEYKRHVDAVYALNVAGWQPVPYARVFDQVGGNVPDILIERFGSRFLTLYSGGDQPRDVNVTIDWSKISPGIHPTGVKDWTTGQVLSANVEADALVIEGLVLVGHVVRIFEILW